MRTRIFYLFLFIINATIWAQNDSIDISTELEYQIESYIENQGEEVDFDYNTILEHFNFYAAHPLNLNQADQYQLENLGLLNKIQIQQFLKYRQEVGDLIAIYELQAIPHFDLASIQKIRPFVSINRSLDDLNEGFKAIFQKSQKQLVLRWGRVLEQSKGYQAREDKAAAYLGDPNRLYMRYLQAYGNRISFGVTMEKDSGEYFFRGTNRRQFDFMSAHFFYKKINKTIERLVVGDFRARFGQGLILNTGYTPGKSAITINIKQTGPTFNRFTSVNEQNYLRGLATTLNLNKALSLSSFISYRKRDGNAIIADTTDIDLEFANFTSLQLSGLHRTEKEMATKNTLKQLNTGWSLKWQHDQGHIALNTLYTHFDQNIARTPKPYNQFLFKGQNLWNASIDYTYLLKNIIFFGETAWSHNNSWASANNLMAHLHSKIAFALQTRFFPRNFHSLYGQTFSETNGVQNENGIYLGLEIRPTRQWHLAAYADVWKHPWLRFRADAPSMGTEYYARLTFIQRKKLEAYIHWKQERKQESYRFENIKTDKLLYKRKTNIRLHLNKKISKQLELRSRIAFSFFNIEKTENEALIWYNNAFRDQASTKSQGFMIFQDIIYKPFALPISFSTRFAIFDIDSYNARIYAFENDVAYQFSIPAYYNKGTRFYINLKYRALKRLILEARFAQTYWANQTSIGSGNDEIEGQTKSSVKIQMRWRF